MAMATWSREPPAGGARGDLSATADVDARAAELLEQCRNLRARSDQLLAEGKSLRQSPVARQAAAHYEPQAGVGAPGGHMGSSRED